MLAMDVVDTLRHRERVVERALTADERDAELVARLRDIYAGQGIEVSDSVIEQGVKDLRENRFAYTPTSPSFKRSLATIYVTRGTWGKPLGTLVTLAAVGLVGYQTLIRGPAEAEIAGLPAALERAHAAVVELAEPAKVDSQADAILDRGQRALAAENYAEVRAAVAELDSLEDALDMHYQIRIRSAPGELSGVWRVPAANENAQNFYLIVEAVDTDGTALTLPIVNEETSQTRQVSHWGQRVDEETFNAIAADKRDDGIIQNRIIGEKRRGLVEPEFHDGVLSGAITDW